VAALGGTPISGFVNGPAAVALAKNLIPPADAAGFEEVRPYLDKVGYLAIGAGSSGDEATAKLIVGLGK
jgi:3-hydroxyisobutyrate dehydrogenase-like beta-hydroxyacid dehydrogenase